MSLLVSGGFKDIKTNNMNSNLIPKFVEKLNSNKINSFEEADKALQKRNNEITKKNEFKDTRSIERVQTRNQQLEGKRHSETGVKFIAEVVENSEGHLIEVVVPKFKSNFDAQLPKDLYKASDRKQFDECNSQLKDKVINNSKLKNKFSDEQLEQIMEGDTPDGYTWHHAAESGKLELVDSYIHAQTGHTGGKSIWGGGTENR